MLIPGFTVDQDTSDGYQLKIPHHQATDSKILPEYELSDQVAMPFFTEVGNYCLFSRQCPVTLKMS